MGTRWIDGAAGRTLATLLAVYYFWCWGAPAGRLCPQASAAVAQAAKIYVFPYQGVFQSASKEILSQITDLVKNELKSSSDVQLQKGPVFIPETAATEIKPLSEKELKQADGLRQQGQKYYEQLNFDKAIESLKGALDRYEKSLALMADFEPVVETLLMLSVCYYQKEQEDEGAKMLVKVVRLRPELVLDPERYPPMFRNVAESIRKKLLLKARGELEVMANVDGATVFFNGRKVGETPLLLKDLVPGEHYLRVEKAGVQPWADKVSIVSTQRQRVAATLGGVKKLAGPLGQIAEALQNNQLTRRIVKTVQEEGKGIGADFMLLGGAAKVGVNYRVGSFLVRVSDGQICPVKAFELDPDLLGASVEVYNMVAELVKRTEDCPNPVKEESVAVVDTVKKKTELKSVSVGPVAPPPEPEAPVAPAPPPVAAAPVRGPAVPSTQPPATPARGPALPAAQPAQAQSRGPAVPSTGPAVPESAAPVTPVAPQVSEEGLVTAGDSALTATPVPTVVIPVAEAVKPIDEVEPRGPRWYQKWWFWTLVGVVVAGGTAGGLYAAGVFDSGSSGASISVNWPVP